MSDISLSELLTKQKDNESALDLLVTLYGKILTGKNETVGLNIDVIRRDITDCLQDLISINESMIAYDGILKLEIDKLEKAKFKIDKLWKRQIEVKEQITYLNNDNQSNRNDQMAQKSKDRADQGIDKTGIINSLNKCIRDNKYKDSFDKYSKLKDSKANQDSPMSIDDIKRSINLLNDSNDSIQREIKLLQSYLNQLNNDQKLINNELRKNKQLINLERDKLYDYLNDINIKLIDTLNEIGLPVPKNKSNTITDILSNLNWNTNSNSQNTIERISLENNDMIAHSNEFIDLKISTLKEQLTLKKNNTSILINDKLYWVDCISHIQNFEQNLQNIMINQINVTNKDLADLIQIEIDFLLKQIKLTENKRLKSLLNNDINAMKLAINELSHTHENSRDNVINSNHNYNSKSNNIANGMKKSDDMITNDILTADSTNSKDELELKNNNKKIE